MGVSTAFIANPEDLPQTCMDAGFKMKKQGVSWGCSDCPKCGPGSGNKFSVYVGRDKRWRWKCQACGVRGDTADFVALVKNINLADALKEVNGEASNDESYTPRVRAVATNGTPRTKANAEALARVFSLIRAHGFDRGARHYLREERCIRDEVIDVAFESGQLRMLPLDPSAARRLLLQVVGRDCLIEAGLMKADGNGWPAIAFRPIVAIEPGGCGAEFRALKADPNSPKAIRYGSFQWPWYLKRNDNPKNCLGVEGFIDFLSCYDCIEEADAIMGFPGTNGWKPQWLQQLHARQPGVLFIAGMDNDEAGNKITPVLVECANKIGLKNLVMQPPAGKDWNDVLRSRRKFF